MCSTKMVDLFLVCVYLYFLTKISQISAEGKSSLICTKNVLQVQGVWKVKKYSSVIVFIIFGTLLWQYANHPRAITQEIHHAIQSKVAELITNDIRKRFPEASQL